MQESVSSIEISFSEFQDHIEFVDLELEGAMVGDAEWDVVLNSPGRFTTNSFIWCQ